MNKQIRALWLIMITVVMVSGCASHRQAKLTSGSDPLKGIAEVEERKSNALGNQHDVLADDKFSSGSEFLAEAKLAQKQGDPAESVMEKASIAKAYFQDAKKIAKVRKSSANRILKARASALKAGVRKSDALVELMMDIDSDLKSETSQFKTLLSPEDFSEFQKKYLVLESKAVQFSKLNAANQAIIQAMENDADDLTPKSLRTASLDYKTAMNIIAQSPRSPTVYKDSVQGSLASATMLFDVMNVIMGSKGTPENIAVQIVKQKRALGELSSNVGKLQANLQTTK